MTPKQHSELDEREYLERLFKADACDRLSRANRDYQQSHAEYIVPLAKLLNATRAERDGLEEQQETLRQSVREYQEQLSAAEKHISVTQEQLESAETFSAHAEAFIEHMDMGYRWAEWCEGLDPSTSNPASKPDEEWSEYHEFRKRTDPPPYGDGLDDDPASEPLTEPEMDRLIRERIKRESQ